MMLDGCPSFDIDQQYPSSLVSNPSSSASWLHTPPAQMPWGIPLADQPSVMRFTGDSCTSARALALTSQAISSRDRRPMGKRKSLESDIESVPPNKQLITDEKMAANFSGLHISTNYTTHQFGIGVEMDNKSAPTGEARNEVCENLPSLVLCEELRRLTSEPVIPASLINKIERPTNAVVLWQPPGGGIYDKLRMVVGGSSKSNLPPNHANNCSMEESEEEVEPQPSTSGLNQFTRTSAQSRGTWPDFLDNNNSSNTVDLNLLPSSGTFMTGIAGETTSDEAMMDL